ncbi:MAG: Asp-tRNA(Asn)/Glu-tRNA(Gln) amidotransferase subunit GatC [Solirubrobacterales bacterium]|nr:Asp-tRNA(Asn)/Glu-tRNA(Gln) amidotransferase subunit GatC [Solirubrobacterales bacterium]
MLSREQVDHVAKLARLELSDAEAERFGVELSKVLDYIDTIRTLSLEEVAPTSHVVEVNDAVRPDQPRPSLPRDVILSQAPEVADDGFAVPSPGASAE